MNFLNKQIKLLLLTIGILLCSAGAVQAADYDGQLDSVTETTVSGWAKDTSTPDNPVKVTLSIIPEGETSPVREITIMSTDYRNSDLLSPHTSGHCGFTWQFDWSELDNGNYQIKMQAGTKKIKKTLSYTNTAGKETAVPVNQTTTAEGSHLLGVFKTTAYCPCYSCSEGWGRRTSTGATARSRHTIAVDPKVIPYGSKVMIDGIVYVAEDRGGGVKGNHIDVFYDSHSETSQHGIRYKEVYLLQ